MLKRTIVLILSWLLAQTPALAATTSGQELLLFYSNDVRGETEPCGCQPNQLGGLSRKGMQLKQIANKEAKPHLTLDAGNLLFKAEAIHAGLSTQDTMAAKTIGQAYSLMGYQAVAVGSQDLSAGIDFLRSVGQGATFTWLSANLVDQASHQPLFPASIRLQAGSVKATVIGLTGPTDLPAEAKATILPWEQVLPALLAAAGNATDLVILLSNLPDSENQRIAETTTSIHLIIQSGATVGAISPEPVRNTVLINTASLGKEMGIMEIDWQPGKGWGVPRAELLAKKMAALDSLQWQLGKYPTEPDPLTALQGQPDRLKAYQLLLGREQQLQQEIAALGQGSTPQEQAGDPSSYRNRLLTLAETLPSQPEIRELSDQLVRAINQLGEEQAKQPVKEDPRYLGAQACGPCHAEKLAAWQQSKHAKAYQTLSDKKQQFNSNCLPCHVTGVGMDQREASLTVAANRRGVGCEACHGPGHLHAQAPKANHLPSRPEVAVCQGCHVPPHDISFDYEQRRKRVH
jgi:hypothetical protein